MKRREFMLMLSAAMTAAGPLCAQQKAMPVIGFLHIGSPGPLAPQLAALRQGLSEIGYVEGRNVAIEYRWAEGHYDRLPGFATELVGHGVDVIAAFNEAAALAAKSATATIPIVFLTAGDPVESGLVASFARPGGNVTGFNFMVTELTLKRFELLSEVLPEVGVFALLVNPNSPITDPVTQEMEAAARAKGIRLHILKASTESEIDAAFAALVELHAGGLLVSPEPFFLSRNEQLAALATRYAVPTIFAGPDPVTAGGLMSYGPSLTAVYRQIGIYAGRILSGAKPANLPVQQPTTFELVVNLKTAKALGLTVPPSVLARAEEVIE